jgi:DNA polymerase III alpha subunit (gram-positive type)
MIQLCRITEKAAGEAGKKKSDEVQLIKTEKDFPLSSRSEIIRNAGEPVNKQGGKVEITSGKHTPVIEKPAKTFSIKEVISESEEPAAQITTSLPGSEKEAVSSSEAKAELTGDSFASAWSEFVDTLKGEGARIVSMFKTIKPEMDDEQTIRIHLSNAAQKDLFIQNYKQKLISFLEHKFKITELDIETAIDQSESNDLLYSDEQKFNHLQKKYPVLKDFRKTFNLDIT